MGEVTSPRMMICSGCSIHAVKLFSSLIHLVQPFVFKFIVSRNYHVDRKIKLTKAAAYIMRELDRRERQIILLRYGLTGGRPVPQREIAARLGISRSYVSRLEKNALEKIRRVL